MSLYKMFLYFVGFLLDVDNSHVNLKGCFSSCSSISKHLGTKQLQTGGHCLGRKKE